MTHRQATSKTGPNTAGIWTTAPLVYLFITVIVSELEKLSFSVYLLIILFISNLFIVDNFR